MAWWSLKVPNENAYKIATDATSQWEETSVNNKIPHILMDQVMHAWSVFGYIIMELESPDLGTNEG